jgi:hypothetical protein
VTRLSILVQQGKTAKDARQSKGKVARSLKKSES